jgi:hypothetical protein
LSFTTLSILVKLSVIIDRFVHRSLEPGKSLIAVIEVEKVMPLSTTMFVGSLGSFEVGKDLAVVIEGESL